MKIKQWLKLLITGAASVCILAAAAVAGFYSECLGQGNSQSMAAYGVNHPVNSAWKNFLITNQQYAEQRQVHVESAVLKGRGAPPGSMSSRLLCEHSGILLHTDRQSVNQILWGQENGGSG